MPNYPANTTELRFVKSDIPRQGCRGLAGFVHVHVMKRTNNKSLQKFEAVARVQMLMLGHCV